jgi:hypothetical protein
MSAVPAAGPVHFGSSVKGENQKAKPKAQRGVCFKCHMAGHFARKSPMIETPSATADEVTMTIQMRAVFSPPDDRSEVYLPAQLHKGSKTSNISAV